MKIIHPDWPVASRVHAACSTRIGGVSPEPYQSLNLATHVGDDAGRVKKNRMLFAQALDLPSEPVWLDQTHSHWVIDAGRHASDRMADASFTTQPEVVCAVLTADCLPVLFSSDDGQTVAAAHGGWRGLLNGILDHTVDALPASNLMVWLGPAIGPDCFEVGAEVRNAFVNRSIEYNCAFREGLSGKYWADIYQIARINLAMLNITAIFGGDFCTVTDKERFFSYRREGETGRMATVIWRD
jgi:YfiH family protein